MMRSMTTTGRGLFAALILALASSLAQAAAITFTHIGTGSGTVGNLSFTDAEFTITAYGDTNSRQSYGGGYFIDHTSAVIVIADTGIFNFVTQTRTFVNNSAQIVGFSRAGVGGLDLFNGPLDSVFSGWDMQSGIGPISGTGDLIQWGLDPVEMADSEILEFTEASTRAIFQASTDAVVPEPGTLALLGLALFGLAGIGRRRV